MTPIRLRKQMRLIPRPTATHHWAISTMELCLVTFRAEGIIARNGRIKGVTIDIAKLCLGFWARATTFISHPLLLLPKWRRWRKWGSPRPFALLIHRYVLRMMMAHPFLGSTTHNQTMIRGILWVTPPPRQPCRIREATTAAEGDRRRAILTSTRGRKISQEGDMNGTSICINWWRKSSESESITITCCCHYYCEARNTCTSCYISRTVDVTTSATLSNPSSSTWGRKTSQEG